MLLNVERPASRREASSSATKRPTTLRPRGDLGQVLADSEGLALMMESGTEGGPTASWQTSTWVEIPL